MGFRDRHQVQPQQVAQLEDILEPEVGLGSTDHVEGAEAAPAPEPDDEPYVSPLILAARAGEQVEFGTQLVDPSEPVEGALAEEGEANDGSTDHVDGEHVEGDGSTEHVEGAPASDVQE